MANTPLAPSQDKVFLAGSVPFMPKWRYLDSGGFRNLSVYVGNGYWTVPTEEALRAFFAALSGGNNWDGDNNSTGYWAAKNFITSSYGGSLAPGDISGGNYIASSQGGGRKGLTTKENAINKWFIGQDADGKFKIQRRDGTNWIDIFVVDTNNNISSGQSQTYSTDGGTTGTTIDSTGVSSSGNNGFQNISNGNTAQLRGNAIAIVSNSTGYATSLRPDKFTFTTGPTAPNELVLVATPITGTQKTQTFQDKTGTVALTSDITAGTAGKEDTANKKTTLTNSTTDYPSTSAVTAALSLNKALIITAADFAGDGINYTNTALANNNSYLLYLNGVRFLIAGTDFTYKTTGGFTLTIPGYTIGANDQIIIMAQVGVSTLTNLLNDRLRAWTNSTAYNLPSITRNSDGAITTASVVWPDLSTGTFTGVPSTAFPGAIDSFNITYVPATGTSLTITQPTLTRDANGAVINQPTLNIS